MPAFFHPHLRVLRLTLRRLLHAPAAALLNILVIGIALSLPVGGYVLLQNVEALTGQLGQDPEISIFLDRAAGPDEIRRLQNQLAAHSAVRALEFVSRDRALQQLRESNGLADVTAGLMQNPLPDAFIVRTAPLPPERLEALREELKTWPHFELVQIDTAWLRKLDALLNFAKVAVGLLATLLSVALVAITFNTIRLQILTQHEEIEVSKLIGATDGYIRRPFLYFGFMHGLLGGCAAWLIITGSVLLLNLALDEVAAAYGSDWQLRSLGLADSLSLLGFSAFLGWIGAWLSVAQHLWQIQPR